MEKDKKIKISENNLSNLIKEAVKKTLTEISAGKAFRTYSVATNDAYSTYDKKRAEKRKMQANTALNYGKNRLKEGMIAYQREIVPLFDNLKRKLEEHNNVYLGGEDIEELYDAIDNVMQMIENEYEDQSHYGDENYYE